MVVTKNKFSFSLISIIIPCLNEEKFISRCLDSLVDNDFPKENLEVLVIDGISEDKTRKIVKSYTKTYSFIKLLENPRKIKPIALNIGVKSSQGGCILIMDAHSIYQKDYVSKCICYLENYNADNVGGVIKTVPSRNALMAKAVAFCLSSFFGAGSSYFRTGSEKPRWVDTVFGGCYKREVFDKIGLFNENLIRSQDMEFNLRLKRAGGRILLAPDIVSYYYPKDNLKDFFLHNIKDGIWAVLPLKFVKIPLKLRHYIPLIFVLTLPLSIWPLTLPLSIWPYILVSFYFSLRIAFQQKDWRYFFVMPIVFAARHIGYGLGSIWGLIRLIF